MSSIYSTSSNKTATIVAPSVVFDELSLKKKEGPFLKSAHRPVPDDRGEIAIEDLLVRQLPKRFRGILPLILMFE